MDRAMPTNPEWILESLKDGPLMRGHLSTRHHITQVMIDREKTRPNIDLEQQPILCQEIAQRQSNGWREDKTSRQTHFFPNMQYKHSNSAIYTFVSTNRPNPEDQDEAIDMPVSHQR
jgi:hypothetical protein